MLKLSREIRFALHESSQPTPPNSANSFAAEPALLDIAAFLTLSATLSGRIDRATGMLINIKIVDKILRQHALPALRDGYLREPPHPAPALLDNLFKNLRQKFLPHALDSLTLHLSPYLSLTIQEPHMIQLSLKFEFSAAHRLHSPTLSDAENQELFGRCNNRNGHGHNYELEVTLAGPPDATGRLFPIHQLQRIVNDTILDRFDHKHLNIDCEEFRTLNPTVENIAAVIFQKLKPAIEGGGGGVPAKLHRIKLWETPKTVAEYSV
ncbi:MAG TPA: 6-carboxytetrahydropterin synthase [Phycisphaerae bacterium]|nr:6-carboxytetrahydropterin synthase [Phycisphaerae bacterium]